MHDSQVFFHEEQRFSNIVMWLPLILALLIVTGAFGFTMLQQIHALDAWNLKAATCPLFKNAPMAKPSDKMIVAMIIGGAVPLIIVVAVGLWMRSIKLVIEVRTGGIYVDFKGLFVSRLIAFKELQKCEYKKYTYLKWIWDYGGWGTKRGFRGQTYSTRGCEGAELAFQNGKYLLLGSQKAKQLAFTINERLS